MVQAVKNNNLTTNLIIENLALKQKLNDCEKKSSVNTKTLALGTAAVLGIGIAVGYTIANPNSISQGITSISSSLETLSTTISNYVANYFPEQ